MKRKDSVFTNVPRMNVKRSRFDLSHEIKLTGKFGRLYPILCIDTLPGDVINDNIVTFARFAPMLSPVMSKIDLKIDCFYVPGRLVYGQKLWEQFITGGQTGTDVPVLPYLTPFNLNDEAGGNGPMLKGNLWDYFRLPVAGVPAASSQEQILVGPFRAYQKIYSDWFRDPNLDDDVELNLETQGNVTNTFWENNHWSMRQRGWRRDYFTSCLPFAQRGTEVLMPLSGDATISYKDVGEWWADPGGAPVSSGNILSDATNGAIYSDSRTHDGDYGNIRNLDGVEFTNSTVSINDLRTSVALQSWMENSARGGGRYVEATEAHFNIRIPDYTLQRSEYIGGLRQPVQISEVLATSAAEAVPIGDMAGHGISVGKKNAIHYRCDEHGFVIVLLSVLPQSSYASQGIARMWSKHNKFDYAFPELMHLGEQAILSKELYYSFLAADDDENNETFGYLPRASEYKFINDAVCGDFRDTLAFWNTSRIFTARPALDSEFLAMDENGTTSDEETYRRIFAVQDGTDYLWIQVFHVLKADRPIPYFSVPRLVG